MFGWIPDGQEDFLLLQQHPVLVKELKKKGFML